MTKILAHVAVLSLLLCGVGASLPSAAQKAPTIIKGEAILAHPAGKLAIESAGLYVAGKGEEAMRLRTSAEQADWKKESAADRKDWIERMKQRAPDPKALTEAIRKGGVLTISPNGAGLLVPMGPGKQAAAYFELEGGKWRATAGPVVADDGSAPRNETRVEGAQILKHPIGELALKYVDALHGGSMDDAMKLASTSAQAKWKAWPASERAESTNFRKKTIPKRSELEAGIASGGILIIEDGTRATLNVITTEQKQTKPGVVQGSSTTVGIPFVLEGGQWKLAQ